MRGSKVVVGARKVALGVKTRVVALKLYCAVVMLLKFARLVTLNASNINRSAARSPWSGISRVNRMSAVAKLGPVYVFRPTYGGRSVEVFVSPFGSPPTVA